MNYFAKYPDRTTDNRRQASGKVSLREGPDIVLNAQRRELPLPFGLLQTLGDRLRPFSATEAKYRARSGLRVAMRIASQRCATPNRGTQTFVDAGRASMHLVFRMLTFSSKRSDSHSGEEKLGPARQRRQSQWENPGEPLLFTCKLCFWLNRQHVKCRLGHAEWFLPPVSPKLPSKERRDLCSKG